MGGPHIMFLILQKSPSQRVCVVYAVECVPHLTQILLQQWSAVISNNTQGFNHLLFKPVTMQPASLFSPHHLLTL